MLFKIKKKKSKIRNNFAIFPKQIGDTIVWLGWWHELLFHLQTGENTYGWSVYGEYIGYGEKLEKGE